jgi:hypothetical protein
MRQPPATIGARPEGLDRSGARGWGCWGSSAAGSMLLCGAPLLETRGPVNSGVVDIDCGSLRRDEWVFCCHGAPCWCRAWGGWPLNPIPSCHLLLLLYGGITRLDDARASLSKGRKSDKTEAPDRRRVSHTLVCSPVAPLALPHSLRGFALCRSLCLGFGRRNAIDLSFVYTHTRFNHAHLFPFSTVSSWLCSMLLARCLPASLHRL